MARNRFSSDVGFDRRLFLQRALGAAGLVALPTTLSGCNLPFVGGSETPEFPVEGPEEALQRLIEGNERFANNKSKAINESEGRRIKVVERQRPFAAIFSCVDSRVPPELIFDRGLGDLFVIRTAGEVVDHAVMGSLEYGAYELEIPLLLVLGHKNCGAVKATMELTKSGGRADGDIEYLIEAIRPAVAKAPGKMAMKTGLEVSTESSGKDKSTTRAEIGAASSKSGEPSASETAEETVSEETVLSEETLASEDTTSEDTAAEGAPASEDTASADETAADETATDETVAEETAVEETNVDGEPVTDKPDPLTEAVKRNVELVVAKVSASPIIADRIRKDRLMVVGAIYDLETGLVELTVNVPKKFLPVEAPTTEG